MPVMGGCWSAPGMRFVCAPVAWPHMTARSCVRAETEVLLCPPLASDAFDADVTGVWIAN